MHTSVLSEKYYTPISLERNNETPRSPEKIIQTRVQREKDNDKPLSLRDIMINQGPKKEIIINLFSYEK